MCVGAHVNFLDLLLIIFFEFQLLLSSNVHLVEIIKNGIDDIYLIRSTRYNYFGWKFCEKQQYYSMMGVPSLLLLEKRKKEIDSPTNKQNWCQYIRLSRVQDKTKLGTVLLERILWWQRRMLKLLRLLCWSFLLFCWVLLIFSLFLLYFLLLFQLFFRAL